MTHVPAITDQPRIPLRVSKKSARIAALIEAHRGLPFSPHYLGYFECFNEGLFYESHDVLEELWLECRDQPTYGFYKALIQFAGAFVHLQKGRLRPAAALFRLAHSYLSSYPDAYEGVRVTGLRILIDEWLANLESAEYLKNPLTPHNAPKLPMPDPLLL